MRYVLLAAIATSLAAAGCGLFGRGGMTVVSYPAGGTPIETKTGTEGNYALYAVDDKRPRVTVNLGQNQTIGFRKDPIGRFFAVAGEQEFPLATDNTYYWKKE